MNWNFRNSIAWATLALLALNSCGPSGPVIDEEDDPAFDRGRSYLKVGKEEEALDEFLSVTRRMVECPKSHLEAGRLPALFGVPQGSRFLDLSLPPLSSS